MNRSLSSANLERVLALIGTWRDGATLTKIGSALNGAVPERTLRRWLTQWTGEGRLVRHGSLRGTHYFLAGAARANGGAPVAAGVASVSPAVSSLSDLGRGFARDSGVPNDGHGVVAERSLVTYQRSMLDAYHPNEMAYLTQAQRMNLSRRVSWSRDALVPTMPAEGRDGGVPAPGRVLSAPAPTTPTPAALSSEWQRFTAELAPWSRDAQVALGLVPRRHRRALRPQIVAGVVARDDVPTMAGELRRIWNHRAAVTAVVASTRTSGLTWATVLAVNAALTRLPAPAAAAGANGGAPSAPIPVTAVSPGCRPVCRTEPLVLAGTAYHPTTDATLIEPCLRQIVLTAAAIQDPAEASFFTFAHLLLLLPFAAENVSSAVLLANVPLLAAYLQPVSLATVPTAALRVAVLSWWEHGRVDPLAQLWARPVAMK